MNLESLETIISKYSYCNNRIQLKINKFFLLHASLSAIANCKCPESELISPFVNIAEGGKEYNLVFHCSRFMVL